MNPSHFLIIHFNIILTSTPGSSKWSFPKKTYNSASFVQPNLPHILNPIYTSLIPFVLSWHWRIEAPHIPRVKCHVTFPLFMLYQRISPDLKAIVKNFVEWQLFVCTLAKNVKVHVNRWFEVLTTVLRRIKFFRDMTQCQLVNYYGHFGRYFWCNWNCLAPEEGVKRNFRNIGNYLPFGSATHTSDNTDLHAKKCLICTY